MRLFALTALVVSGLCYSVCAYSDQTVNYSRWYTAPDERYKLDGPPTAQEASEIIAHPIYKELSAQKDYYRIRRFEIVTGIAFAQLKQNTVDAVMIGKSNIMPALSVEGNIWLTRWFGLGVNWTNVIFISMGSAKDPAVPNPVYVRPSWLDLYGKFRYMFNDRDGSSSVALKIGRHSHDFPILTYPQYISKYHAEGLAVGVESKIAFSNMYGISSNFDYLWLPKLQDDSSVSNGQRGIGYRFVIDLYGTVMDAKGMKTMISVGYGQTSYISELNGPGVTGDSRPALGVDHFEQTYSNVHINFTARI
jgi:hypothetical protein